MGWRYTDDPSPSPSTAAPNPGGWRYTDAALMRGKTSALGAFASGAADGLTLGFGDEASSAVRALMDGGDWGAAYARRVMEARGRQADFQADHNGLYIGGQVAGSMLPFVSAGLGARGALALAGRGIVGKQAGVAAAKASRNSLVGRFGGLNLAEDIAKGGGGSVLRRMLAGGMIGIPYGAVAGMGHGDGADPVSDGLTGAMWGGATGAAFPAAFGLAGALKQAAAPTIARAPVSGGVIDDAVMMSSGGLDGPPRPPGSPPASDLVIEESALDKFLRLVGQNRTTLDDLDSQVRANLYGDPGRGRTMVDELGVGAEKTMKYLNKSPGETAGLSDEVFSPRNRDTFNRIEREVDEVIPGPERGMMGRRADARKEFERLRENEFKTIWSNKDLYTPARQDAARRALDLLQQADDPLILAGIKRAEIIYSRPQVAENLGDAMRGAPTPPLRPLNEDPIRQLHYIKRGIDEEIAFRADPLNPNKLTEEEGATARLLRGSIRRVLDDLIPGYRAANQKFGDEQSAIYAMNLGRRLMRGRMNPRLMEEFQELTPFEKQSALVGIKDDLLETLRTGDREGRRNIADLLLNGETQRRMRELLGEGPAARLQYLLSTESKLFRTAQYAGARSGSDTGVAAAEMFDDFAYAANRPTGPVDAAWTFGQKFLDDITAGVAERRRNAVGRLLLQNTDDPTTRKQVEALFALLRKRAEERAAVAHGSASGGAQGGAAYGTWQDNTF